MELSVLDLFVIVQFAEVIIGIFYVALFEPPVFQPIHNEVEPIDYILPR